MVVLESTKITIQIETTQLLIFQLIKVINAHLPQLHIVPSMGSVPMHAQTRQSQEHRYRGIHIERA